MKAAMCCGVALALLIAASEAQAACPLEPRVKEAGAKLVESLRRQGEVNVLSSHLRQPEEATLNGFTALLMREAESIAFLMSGRRPGTYRRFEDAVRSVMSSPEARAECFPSLVKLLEEGRAFRKAREAEAAERAKAAEEAEQARAKAAQAAEERRRWASAEKARKDALPVNGVYHAYQAFAYLQMCAQTREGYAVVYVSDEELRRATLATKAIESKAQQDDPNLPALTEIWDKTVQVTKDLVPNLNTCQSTFDKLMKASPVSTYTLQPP